MEKIFSKIEPETLLHIIFRKEDFIDGRVDIIDAENFLQCAAIIGNKGKTFRPHKHNVNFRSEFYHAQESWVCVNGSFKAILYDVDDSIIAERILVSGDTSITLNAGHNYEFLEDGTRILEYKTGKYLGVEKDKTFIDGNI